MLQLSKRNQLSITQVFCLPQVLNCISAKVYVALVFIRTNNLVSLQPSTVTPINLNYDNSLPPCPHFFSLQSDILSNFALVLSLSYC